ncbi:MAG TPA: hypothetical protein VE961_07225 [Pyrinomonadaceae bacterium]|nr:hypothetical protein [Pyrinomonadaceae bacterium]
MLKKSATCLVLPTLFALALVTAQAQSDDRKFEVGGHFTVLRVPQQTITVSSSGAGEAIIENGATNYGFGGRFGYRLTKYFTLEAEGNFFPHDGVLDAGKKTQGFFGVKAGKRFGNFGVFAKAKPGFVHYSRGDYLFTGPCIAVVPPPIGCFQPEGRTNFAADLGGVFEYYPSKRTIIRFDVGATLVRLPFRNEAAFQTNPVGVFSLVVVPAAAETRSHFQAGVGFGFRF